jgi:hypothetical protein
MTIHPHPLGHSRCACPTCNLLRIYPEMPFIDPPSIDEVHANEYADWKVACNWLGPLIDGRATLIRKEFPTDGGSIPPAAQSIVGNPFQMPALAHFLEHDAMYAARLYRRAVCDARMYRGMALDGHITLAKRGAIWSMVREFGGIAAWSKHTEASITRARTFCRIVGEEEYFALSASRICPA